MRSLLGAFMMIVLGACSGGNTGAGSCLVYAAAGGNSSSNPSFQWEQTQCACVQPPPDGSAAGSSCGRTQACASTCCTCPDSSGWTFTASACMNNSCLDAAATCQAVLAADSEPCKMAP